MIIRVSLGSKAQVGQSIFVCTIDQGLCRELTQSGERSVHHAGIALKDPATSAGKKRVTAKKQG